jgi:LmbE family N-acetylglucosaminyl deacetylase
MIRMTHDKAPLRRFALLLFLLATAVHPLGAQQPAPQTAASQAAAPQRAGWPRVLLVTAHPDDDALFGGSVYKITHSLGGRVDVAVITNGEAGFHYSELAIPIYHLDLTDEKVARESLPGIRKKEMMAGGAIVGITNFFFFDQKDEKNTTDLKESMADWDVDYVREHLRRILLNGDYDFVFVMLPTATTHGGHQGAALLGLEVVSQLPADHRPIVLAATGGKKGKPPIEFPGRPELPLTRMKPGAPVFEFDRTRKFGYNDKLDYNIVVNWEIAEHKSQGAMQLVMNLLEVEQYFYLDFNRDDGIPKARALFDRLAQAPPIARP